jgi:hypothetical protein
MTKQECPRCGIENTDNWPLDIDGKIIYGGCQNCWEREVDDLWWELVTVLPDDMIE